MGVRNTLYTKQYFVESLYMIYHHSKKEIFFLRSIPFRSGLIVMLVIIRYKSFVPGFRSNNHNVTRTTTANGGTFDNHRKSPAS
jgi:hypothetical protein